MIYEVRTYDVKPGALPELLDRVAAAYEHRKKYSELVAFWYSEIGPLNQVVHVWPYESAEERARIRAEAARDPNWPPTIHELLVRMESEIYVPFPFSPRLEPGHLGPVYEMRSYMVRPGVMARIMERWEKALPARTALSPLAAVMHTDAGPLNKYIHIWPYESLEQRAAIRRRAVDEGVWPPPGGADLLVSQANKILLPAAFSPMQ